MQRVDDGRDRAGGIIILPPPLFAVHLSDGVLAPEWAVGGLIAAGLIVVFSARRLTPDEYARVGVMAAAFFVASQLHLPVGVGSVHLLLNGVVGVVLRRRAALAVCEGLLFQTMLFGHGGLLAFGVNLCVLAIPAVVAGYAYPLVRKWAGLPLTFLAWLLWAVVAIAAVEIAVRAANGERGLLAAGCADRFAFSPAGFATAAGIAVALTLLVRRMGTEPAFAAGLVLGLFAGLFTVSLNVACLALGGAESWSLLAGGIFVAYLPVIAVEAVATGVVVAYLEAVKPEWLRRRAG